MKQFECEVYGPKGTPGCVIVTVNALSASNAKRLAVPPARILWWDIPLNPKVVVRKVL